MPSRVALARISGSAILLEDAVFAVTADDVGAVATFSGIVRNHDTGRTVAFLEYEAHPSAATVLAAIAASVASDFDGVRIAIEHRTGTLAVGELALTCAVSSAHRADALVACARIVEDVKHGLPIWKRQRFTDGTDEWVGSL